MEAKMIRVLLADEHDFVISSLQLAFDMVNNIELVGRAENGIEAVELAGELLPDVILMDIIMPEMDGLAATRIIREKYPQIKIIVLTASTLEADQKASMEAGAHIYLRKETSMQDLIAIIRKVVH
jgi:two-component system, NarL family, response regulator LiaR